MFRSLFTFYICRLSYNAANIYDSGDGLINIAQPYWATLGPQISQVRSAESLATALRPPDLAHELPPEPPTPVGPAVADAMLVLGGPRAPLSPGTALYLLRTRPCLPVNPSLLSC